MTVPADAAQREAAVTGFSTNLSVVAGAGAGKTSLLVERVVQAVLAHSVPLSRIAAITFTEMAAGELRERIGSALRAATAALESGEWTAPHEAGRALRRLRDCGFPPGDVLARARAALEDEAEVTTIHGFTARLLRRRAAAAGLPPGFQVDDGSRWREFVDEQCAAGLEAAASGSAEPGWRELLPRFSLSDVRAVVAALAELPAPHSPGSHPGLSRALREEAEQHRAELAEVLAALEIAPRYALHRLLTAHVQAWSALLAAPEEEAAADPGRILGETGILPQLHSSQPSVPRKDLGVEPERCLRALQRSRLLLRDLALVDGPATEQLLRASQEVAHRLAADFLRTGWITFDGLLTRAAELLRCDAQVRRAEASRIDHLLIDEFQDTDPLQCEIALQLCERRDATPAASPWSTRLRAGSLFVVGDPKQSIYRFRGADLEIYHRAVQRILAEGGRELTLEVSFRSPARLVEALNTLFARALPAKSRSESGFEPTRSGLDETGRHTPLEIWSVEGPSTAFESVAAGRRAEGRLIAARISRWLDEGRRAAEVAILLRSLGELHHYLRPLREAGIPTVVDGGRTFVARTEVKEVLSLLLAAADPTDPVALLGALRSSLLAVPDAEIAAFARWTREASRSLGKRRAFHVRHARGQGQLPSLAAAARQIAHWQRLLDGRGAEEVVDTIVEDGNLTAVLAAQADGAQCLANVRKLAQLCRERVARTGLPLGLALREVVESLEGAEGTAESSLADAEVDAVRILTIHKAKGLEFPVVIVPDLARTEQTRPGFRPELGLLRGAEPPAAAVRIPEARTQNLAMALRRAREREHAEAEARRLLYVALTRAQEHLVLVHHRSAPRRSPWLAALSGLGYQPAAGFGDTTDEAEGGRVRHERVAEADIPAVRERPAGRPPRSLAVSVLALRSSAASARADRGPLQGISGAEREALPDTAARPLPSDDAERSRAVGIACHAALERSAPGAPPSEEAELTGIDLAACRTRLAPVEFAAEVHRILHGPGAQRLYGQLAGVEVVGREIPLLYSEGDAVHRGVADLVYRRGPELTVADYKTDRTDRPEDLEERYAAQLSLYARAVQAALSLRQLPGMELLMLRTGQRIPLSPGRRPPRGLFSQALEE